MKGVLDGIKARDKAIDQVERNADPDWKKEARTAIEVLAASRDEFTTDAVWAVLEKRDVLVITHEKRAMGAIMRSAQKDKWVEGTDRHVLSTRKKCHRRPIRVWRSLVRG